MLRKARKEDLPQMIDMLKIILEDMDHPSVQEMEWSELKEMLVELGEIEGFRNSYAQAFVSEIDGQIAGVCFGYPAEFTDDIERISKVLAQYQVPGFTIYEEGEAFPGEWYLDTIVTGEDFRGRGIGKEMLAYAEEVAGKRGYSVIGLNCDQNNHKARKLYESFGYEKVGEVKLVDHMYDHLQKRV